MPPSNSHTVCSCHRHQCGSISEAHLSILTGNLQTITQGKDYMAEYLDKVKAIHDQMLVTKPDAIDDKTMMRHTL